MRTSTATSHLLLAVLVKLVPAQVTQPTLPQIQPAEEGQSGVMSLEDVLLKSMCQPMEQLVDVEHEFPNEVEYTYIPPCVPLWRCSGCCMDEILECHPTLERNITMEMMRISHGHVDSVNLTFVEHVQCECRVRQEPPNNESGSLKKKPRKRRHKKAASGCRKCHIPHT
ncbi:vascular endothelial growth factor A-like isoform X2 [Mugil cephalus]|uniref:vascular endothelial growth factor A-like isoform X2 n=1 Tax=Mugil cephalus TaxID=48193 RepID=UPI001FB5B7AB|nr:vascular endothelial growth factor A-like isoform X2 [Mugil cephalus]